MGVADFFGVAFLAVAFFGAAVCLVLIGAAAFVLVTRPDLVLVSTFGTSTMAGAYDQVNMLQRTYESGMLTLVGALALFFALGLAVLAFGVAAAVFLAAGAFFVVVPLVADFFGAAFLVVVAGVAFGLASLASLGSFGSLASFYMAVSDDGKDNADASITDLGSS